MTFLFPGITTVLQPLSVREWSAMYRAEIRVIVDWEELLRTNPKVSTEWFMGPSKLSKIGRTKGSWMKGAKIDPVVLGGEGVIVRAPAVRSKGRTIVIDGQHRIYQLRPRLLVLDVIECDAKQQRFFADLLFDEKGKA